MFRGDSPAIWGRSVYTPARRSRRTISRRRFTEMVWFGIEAEFLQDGLLIINPC
jgi:hypothetical protein